VLRRILIANRGEIAVRIIRACRELGLESVAVYSDADARALHVSLADRAVRIGPPPPAQSYLSMDAVLDAAAGAGADAIHPGYGFLSENASFAARCVEAGLIFVGPPAAAIEAMGSKVAARTLAHTAGVPVVPGEAPSRQDDDEIAAAVRRVGFPSLLKPAAGGGGIGMKVLRHENGVDQMIRQARREAQSAFGDGTLYVERLIERPRHVEFQIIADAHGNVVHLFERECSLQRRNQKVIEETPSPALTAALRTRMGDAAVKVARAAGYQNAGTVEFLVEGAGDWAHFYFLEMNTRLQVEHPITEQVVGVDLVRAQLAVASGQKLPWTQDQLSQRGHAFEARIYAEDPAQGDLPQAGPLLLYREPSMPGLRIDSGVAEGGEVTVHYDPMIAKLIATAETRDAARTRAIAALRAFPILGVRTNIRFLIALLEHPAVIAGDVHTAFIDLERERAGDQVLEAIAPAPTPGILEVAAAARATGASASPGQSPAADPWTVLRGARV
jgi:acetyl-CoA carboxylase biotin carboxylase subunit